MGTDGQACWRIASFCAIIRAPYITIRCRTKANWGQDLIREQRQIVLDHQGHYPPGRQFRVSLRRRFLVPLRLRMKCKSARKNINLKANMG